ncbi:unnamed protein product [Mucor fragilis]
MKLFYVVVQSFVSGLFIADSDAYKHEIGYNYRIIWPIMDCLSKLMETTRFQPGETRLRAIYDELKLVDKDENSHYNADGLILNSKYNLEIAIVETTGPFHHVNNSKETQDYIKAGYGLVSMLHHIGRRFSYGSFDIFTKIGVFFIQVTPTKLRIWRMSMPHSKLYIKNCIGSVEIPTKARHSEENLRKLVNLFWLMKQMISESYEAIDALESSHVSNMKIKTRKAAGHEDIGEIQSNFKRNTIVKLPNVYIQKTRKLNMNKCSRYYRCRQDNSIEENTSVHNSMYYAII